MKDADLVAAYLAHAETRMRDGTDAEHFAAREELDELVTDEPERAWPIICEMIGRIVHDDILAYVAAGPLEDLLVRHPQTFIDRLRRSRNRIVIFGGRSREYGDRMQCLRRCAGAWTNFWETSRAFERLTDSLYGIAAASQPTPLQVSATKTSDRISQRSPRFTH